MTDPEQSISGQAEATFWLEPIDGGDEALDSRLAEVLEFLPVGYLMIILVDRKQNKTKIMLHKAVEPTLQIQGPKKCEE